MTFYAVIDTNVILSALLSKKDDTATVLAIKAVLEGKIIPLYHQDIISEYNDVLSRAEFNLNPRAIDTVLLAIKQFGVEVFPKPSGEILAHMDDLIFYEATLEKRNINSYLVTGNKKHFPIKSFIVSPAEMLQILNND